MGTPELSLRWIAVFLTAQQQQVRIGGSQLSWLQLCGGAPQGIHLVVNLFVVHINDLEFKWQYSKYIDDTNIIHISSDPASVTLQNGADTAHIWSKQYDMIINAAKTKELRIDFTQSGGSFSQLNINNSPIEVVSLSKTRSNYQWWPQMEPTCGVHHWQSLTATTFIVAMPSSWYPLKWNVTHVHNQNSTGTGICVCRMASWPNPISNRWHWKGAYSSNAHDYPRIIVWGWIGLLTVTNTYRQM